MKSDNVAQAPGWRELLTLRMRRPDVARKRGVVPPVGDREWRTDAVECMGGRAPDLARQRAWSAAAGPIGSTAGVRPKPSQNAKREQRFAGKLGV